MIYCKKFRSILYLSHSTEKRGEPDYCLNVYEANGSGRDELRDRLPVPLLSCETLMFVKENRDRRKN